MKSCVHACSAAAKSLQSCPTLCDPIDGSPPGSPIPGILQASTLEWVAISFSNAWKWKVKVKSLSRVQPLATPWTAAFQAPPSMGFSRQEYWSRVPLPSPACVLSYVQFLVPHALQSNRLLCSWDSPGNKTGMDCHLHFQGIFQGSNPSLLHRQADSLPRATREGHI